MRMTHFWPSTVSAAVAAHSARCAAARRAARDRVEAGAVWSPASIRTRTLAPAPAADQPNRGPPWASAFDHDRHVHVRVEQAGDLVRARLVEGEGGRCAPGPTCALMIGSSAAGPSVPSVTVCAAVSAFSNVTSVPAGTVSCSVLNAKPLRVTVDSVARPPRTARRPRMARPPRTAARRTAPTRPAPRTRRRGLGDVVPSAQAARTGPGAARPGRRVVIGAWRVGGS